jgi:hypothetical protein
MAGSFMQSIAQEIEQKLGSNLAKIAGSMNYEDTADDNPETRQEEFINYCRSIMEDEDIEDSLKGMDDTSGG